MRILFEALQDVMIIVLAGAGISYVVDTMMTALKAAGTPPPVQTLFFLVFALPMIILVMALTIRRIAEDW